MGGGGQNNHRDHNHHTRPHVFGCSSSTLRANIDRATRPALWVSTAIESGGGGGSGGGGSGGGYGGASNTTAHVWPGVIPLVTGAAPSLAEGWQCWAERDAVVGRLAASAPCTYVCIQWSKSSRISISMISIVSIGIIMIIIMIINCY